jgi:cell division septum initiation protein DivIVA
MANNDHSHASPAPAPFAVVLRGYDREQVTEQFRRFQQEIRVVHADRDATAAHARELTDLLDEAQDEIDNLRREIDRLAVPPTTAEGMGDRIARMMRLASDEASEIRANAEAEAAEVRSIAQQEAAAMRREAEQIRQDMVTRRTAMEEEHTRTMAAAKTEAERILSSARADADRLDRTAQENRERVQNDFDVAMSTRRDRAIALITELEDQSQAEAAARLSTANERSSEAIQATNDLAERTIEETNTTAANQVAEARRIAEQMMEARTSIMRQLDAVRAQLEQIPAALAAPDNEASVVAQRIAPAAFEPVTAPRAEHLTEPDATAGRIAPQRLNSDEFPVAAQRSLPGPPAALARAENETLAPADNGKPKVSVTKNA